MLDDPLLKALPPATDYLTYLTILEYNLTVDRLPTLHHLLQDTTLTTNIGWDLVHLLLPLLPASEPCLQDISRVGNPREVILKVTELLETISRETEGNNNEETEEEDLEERVQGIEQKNNISDSLAKATNLDADSRASAGNPTSSTPVLQFQILLHMLSVLHPRIKTRYPSRFLSTSLQAIIPAHAQLVSDSAVTEAVVSFAKTISGTKRPRLPPRLSSTAVTQAVSHHSAPDPEAENESSAPEDATIRQHLLQSFLTQVAEDYINSLPSVPDAPGLAWTARWHEKKYSEMVIPERQTYSSMFAEDSKLHERDTIIGQLAALAQDLQIRPTALLSVITGASTGLDGKDSDISLSAAGALYLFVAVHASSELFQKSTTPTRISIFPDHAEIVKMFIGDDATGAIGMQRDTLIDAVLFLGFSALGVIGLPENDEQFYSYLQKLSLLSANTPSPTLRYQAHMLTSAILHAHSSDHVRLCFIRDTLEHCPYESLKASAVGWLKDEILAATVDWHVKEEHNLFASSAAIESVAPFLYLGSTEDKPSIEDFYAQVPFYLAVLNFHWLLCSSQIISQALDVKNLNRTYEIKDSFLGTIQGLANEAKNASQREQNSEELQEGSYLVISEIQLLEHAIGRSRSAIDALNAT